MLKLHKKGLLFLGVIMILVMGLAITGCTPQDKEGEKNGASPDEPYVIDFTVWMPGTEYVNDFIKYYADEIEKETDGRVKVDLYLQSTLLSGWETYQGIVEGVADLGQASVGLTPGRFPLAFALELPGIERASGKAASYMFKEVMDKLEQDEFNDVKVLMYCGTGSGHLMSKVPIRTLDDLRGLEVRCTASTAIAVEKLGAKPIAMEISEVYEALQKGVMDAHIAVIEQIKAHNLAEVVDYVTLLPFINNSASVVVMNKNTFNSLPEDLQKIIEDVSERVWEEVVAGFWDEVSKNSIEWAVEEHGVEVITLDEKDYNEWMSLVQGVLDEYCEDLNEQGYNGTALKELILEAADKYNEMYPAVY